MICWGIVGHEAAKFTPATEALAREAIRSLLTEYISGVSVVSGKCHLGGIDIWAVEEAQKLNIPWREFPPEHLSWEGGYKKRNIEIAYAADCVVSIVVKELPPSYHGMRFKSCYHCGTTSHVKSGGCWTAKYAKGLGKPIRIIEI